MSTEGLRTLIDRHSIARRVRELGAEIASGFQGGVPCPCLVPVMDGEWSLRRT